MVNFPIKSSQWFYYYNTNKYYTNLIEIRNFKKHFIKFLEKHRHSTSRIIQYKKKFKKYISDQRGQARTEILSDFFRMNVICEDLGIDASEYEACLEVLKREYFRLLGYNFMKDKKKLFEEMVPPLPEERYSEKDVEEILSFFGKRRKKLKVYVWKSKE